MLFLLSLYSLTIQSFGIRTLYFSSFPLRGTDTQGFRFFPADRVPSPDPCAYRAGIFLCPTPCTEMQTLAVHLRRHAQPPQSSGSKTPGHAVPIKSNFSDKERARTGLIIGSGRRSFPSLGKRSDFSCVSGSCSLLFTSLALTG